MSQQQTVETVMVAKEEDVVSARVRAKAMAEALGFGNMDQTRIATAVSELARNAVQYAGKGNVKIRGVDKNGRKGMEIVVEDKGPGIKNLEKAMEGGHSTSGGLGLGLSGSRKLMDEFDLKTGDGEGTVITIRKWL